MNHKRGKRKNARAGCLMCKPNKANGANTKKLGHVGFGKLRAESAAEADCDREMLGDDPELYGLENIGNK